MYFHSTHGTEGCEEVLVLATILHVKPLLAQLMALQLACTCKATANVDMPQTCGTYWEHAVHKHLLQLNTPLAPPTKASTQGCS